MKKLRYFIITVCSILIPVLCNAQDNFIHRPFNPITEKDTIFQLIINKKTDLLDAYMEKAYKKTLTNKGQSVKKDELITFKENVSKEMLDSYKMKVEDKDTIYEFKPILNPIISYNKQKDESVLSSDYDYEKISADPILRSATSVTLDKNKSVGRIPYESNIVNGAVSYTVPVQLVQGGSGLQPSISLNYNSLSGNGIAGYGWSIGGLSTITVAKSDYYFDGNAGQAEKKDKSSAYELDGVRLIKTSETTLKITYETETGNITVINHAPSGKYYFEAFYPDGRKGIFGYTTQTSAQIEYPLTRMTDNFSNYIDYTYSDPITGYYRISEIKYGTGTNQLGSVWFSFESRNDIAGHYVADTQVRMTQRLYEIRSCPGTSALFLYKYLLSYEENTVSLLKQISMEAGSEKFNPLVFNYGNNYGTGGFQFGLNSLLQRYFANSKAKDLILQKSKFNVLSKNDGMLAYPNFERYGITATQSGNCSYGSRYDSSQELLIYKDLSSGYSNPQSITAGTGFQQLNAVDINGDGNDELVKINYYWENNYGKVVVTTYNASMAASSASFLIEGTFSEGNLKSPLPRFFLFGDFNGDGKTELLTIYGNKYPKGGTHSSTSRATLINLENRTKIHESLIPAMDVFTEYAFAADLNGDGKSELCVVRNAKTEIYSYINNAFVNTGGEPLLWASHISGGELMLADFNGDGKTDIVISPPKNDTGAYSTYWRFYRSTGTGLSNEFISTGINYREGYKFLLQDINGDGLPDLVINQSGRVSAILNKNGSFSNSSLLSNYLTVESDAFFISGDVHNIFYGQLLSIKDAVVKPISYTGNDGLQRLMTSCVNSRGVTTQYNYSSFMDNGLTTTTAYSYPYAKVKPAIYIVSGYTMYADNNLVDSKSYSYYDAVMHKQRNSLIGYGKIVTNDNIMSQTTTQIFDPTKMGSLTSVESATHKNTYNYSLTVASNKIAKLRLTSFREQDNLRNLYKITSYQYDTYGNVTNESMSASDLIESTTVRTYFNSTSTSNYIIGALTSQSVARSNRNGSVPTIKDTYTLNSKNIPVEHIQAYVSNNRESTTLHEKFVYDNYGNKTQHQTKTYWSTNWLTTKYEYDVFGRVVKETSPITSIFITKTYNNKGLLETVKDHKNNTTRYDYDAWGRQNKVTHPDGVVETVASSWSSGSGNGLYVETKTATGKPVSKIYYDALGRDVKSSVTRFNGNELSTSKEYNNKGQVSRISLPYTGSTPNRWNTYSYDSYNRITALNYASGKRDTYSYSEASVTATVDNVATTKTYNVLGEITKVVDPAGTITYNLRADGQPISIVAPGGVTTRFNYNNYGLRESIAEHDGGTRVFFYDHFGNVAEETNARGNMTTYEYDSYNRLTKIYARGDLETNYAYNSDNQLISVSSDNGTSKSYTYDNLLRLKTEKEVAPDNKFLQKTYNYASGNVSSVEYATQSGNVATENYTYSNGHLTEVKVGTTVIWKLNAESALGLPTNVTTGPLERAYMYDEFGLPNARNTKRGTTVIQNFTYSINPQTNNLSWRKDNQRNIQENFGYDGLNRLTSVPGKTISYDIKGNITNYQGVASYTYNSSRPYAIQNVTLADNSIPVRNQSISYNWMNRPETISENGYQAAFVYNSDKNRVRMQIKRNNAVELTRYYVGGQYEYDTGVAGVKERLYLGGDAYSAAAVYVKEGSTAWTVNYICRDYLGSITHVTDASGNVRQELSYDAWGRLRNPVNQSLYAIGSEPTTILGRGYTGHEHLTMFGLVNMNARLYEPTFGRFLSPDPYVQAPYMSQNFNRYSYALNNPLRYTDENGEVFRWAHGAISGFIKGVTNAIKGRGIDHIFTDTWKGFANAVKIDYGLFKGTPMQIFSRFTWELPQTFIGNQYSHYRNIVWNVDKVRYFDGATFVINANSKKNDGVSIGSYLNINIKESYDKNIYEPNGKFTPINDPLFMHEYGHYIQSQKYGWGYLFSVGIPSISSASKSKGVGYFYDSEENRVNVRSHSLSWMEIGANKKAKKYFEKYGVTWQGKDFNGYFTEYPENIIKY